MTCRAGVGIAVAILAGISSGPMFGCIDEPLFIPLGDVPDGGEPSPPATDAGEQGDAAANAHPAPSPHDAPGPCAQRCAAAGGTCEGETCVLACSASSPCKGSRKCPPGLACRIVCEGKQACDKVDCASATSCAVSCSGERACNGDVRVDAPAGQITCEGLQACNGKVECKGSSCAISCGGVGCKEGDLKCCATQCTVDGRPTACK